MLYRLGKTSLLRLEGRESLDLLHRISTNALATLPAGGVAWTLFVTDKGRLIDHCLVLAGDAGAMILCSPGAAAVVRSWIEKFVIMEDVTVTEEEAGEHVVALGGPGDLPFGGEFPEPGRWRTAAPRRWRPGRPCPLLRT